MTTPRCRSAPTRRSRSRTWSRASARELQLRGGETVLDVGTGSGYQAAVLAELAAVVHSLERIPALAERARETLDELGYAGRVHVHVADGTLGWPESAPYAAIAVAAAHPAAAAGAPRAARAARAAS